MKFSQQLAADSPFRAPEFVAGNDAVALARDILALDQEAFSAAFRKSPMKRATLRGMQRNAAVVLGKAGTSDNALLYDDGPSSSRARSGALPSENCWRFTGRSDQLGPWSVHVASPP